MRLALGVLVFTCVLRGQFRSTVPLVVAPTTVTDAKGRFVDGLSAEDLILYDNNVPQRYKWNGRRTRSTCGGGADQRERGAVVDKLGGSGILFAELLAAEGGETAVIAFRHEVRKHLDFAASAERVTRALRMLRKEGGGPCTLDALQEAFAMLERRPAGRRRIVLVIGERRERGGATALAQAAARGQRLNAPVHRLTFSPFLLRTRSVRRWKI